MRTFNNYSPLLIAKYVAAFFKGHFSIQGLGTFQFDRGRVLIDNSTSDAQRVICKEINTSISAFKKSV